MKKKVFIAVSLIFLLTILLAGRYVYDVIYGAKTIIATVKTIENSEETLAYIVKNETVISLSDSSFYRLYLKEGDKVSANEKIASLYSSEDDGLLISEIENIEEKIENLSSEYMDYTPNDIVKIEKYIDETIDSLSETSYKGELSEGSILKGRLDTLFNLKYKSSNSAKEEKEALIKKKTELEANLSRGRKDLYSPITGIFSENTDGLEAHLSPDEAMKLTVDEFSKVIEEKGEASDRECKIVDNSLFYISSKVSSSSVVGRKKGDKVKIVFPKKETIQGRIEYISEPADDFCIITISSDRFYENLGSERKTDVKIIFETHEGFVIPNSALHFYEGEYGVFVLKHDKTYFKKARVIYSDDKISVIAEGEGTDLQLYDKVVTDGDLSQYYD